MSIRPPPQSRRPPWDTPSPQRKAGSGAKRAFTRVYGTHDGPRRRVAIGATAFLGTFVVGYIVAATLLFPSPIFRTSKKVPRLIGLSVAEAEEALRASSLVASDTDRVNHPTAPAGEVVWQDPPPRVAVPAGTGVQLSVSRGPQRVQMPNVTDYQEAVARQVIEAAGLRVARIDTTQAPVPRGVVVSTRPPAGQTLAPGSGVILFVSVGAPTISVPDLTGLTVDEAREVLEEAGLVMGSTRTRRVDGRPPGTVVEQQPAAGTLSSAGAAIGIVLVRDGNR